MLLVKEPSKVGYSAVVISRGIALVFKEGLEVPHIWSVVWVWGKH